jgi:hypothetical protein
VGARAVFRDAHGAMQLCLVECCYFDNICHNVSGRRRCDDEIW